MIDLLQQCLPIDQRSACARTFPGDIRAMARRVPDLTEDLRKLDVPTLIIHGDDDQIVPIADPALLSAKIVKDATLKIYKGAPHGLCTTHKNLVNEDLLAFIRR